MVRDIVRRSLNSAQTLLLMKSWGNRITEPFHSLSHQPRSSNQRMFFRCCSDISMYCCLDGTETNEEKLQKKEKRIEKIEKEKRQLINFGHKFNQMGGTKVVVAYFGLFILHLLLLL